MTDWQERITAGTDPSVRAEHVLRYRVAGPIVRSAATWCDLGCGTGLAAASATDGPYDGRLVLVDVDEAAVVQAAAHLAAPDTTRIAADLNDAGGRAAVRAAVLDGPAPRAITTFEVLEHVRDLPAVLSLLVELATEHETTVVLSVPNDAFWAIENPFHETMWSASAFAELRAMLPDGHVFAEQVPLRGSRIAMAGSDATAPGPPDADDGAAPSHFLAAFGPAAGLMRAAAVVFEADQLGERRWIRERESHLAHLEAVAAQLEEWRRYIHDLEDRLGLPRAGSEAAIASERADGS
jgi:2-polyprenyl-3-methyl-5-hydroxy-6-metoxy-1,4-benzoquinol methylase